MKNMSMRTKIIGLVLVPIIGLVALSVLIYNESNTLSNEFDKFTYQSLPIVTALEEMKFNASRIISSVNENILDAQLAGVEGIEEDADEEDESNTEGLQIEEAQEAYLAALEQYRTLVTTVDQGDSELLTDIEIATQELFETTNTVIELQEADESLAEIAEAREVLETVEQDVLAAIQAGLEEEQEELANSRAEVSATTQASIRTAISASVIALVVVAGLVMVFLRSIFGPLNNLLESANQLAQGNFSARSTIDSTNEVGQVASTFNQMAEYVQRTQTELREANANLEKRVDERTSEIRDIQQRTQTIIDNLPNSAVFLIDRDYKVLLADGPELTSLGVTDQMLGQRITDFLEEDVAQHVASLYEGAFNGETQETVLEIADTFYASTYLPLYDEDGQVNTILGLATNVTESRKAQEAIRESEERFRQLAESIDEFFFLVSLDAQESYYISPNFEAIYGIPVEEAYENPTCWMELVHPDDMHIVKAGFEVMANGENYMAEWRVFNKSGDLKWVESRQSLVIGDDGQPRAVAGVVSDVTARKNAEAEREGLIKDLRAAKRIAEENSRLKSEFLSMMSHELRTPMNAIEGFTSIMLNRMAGTDYNEKSERYLGKIQSNSKRLLGLINDFLDLSRIESGRLELANMPMFPAKMAQSWKDNLSSLAEKKGLELEVNVDPNLPETLYGDEESISKIAINLLGNAIKFTDEGHVTLSLEKQDGHMVMSIQDTGIGIPPHAKEYIFDEFRQVDMSSKRQYGGTGLGLSIVQKLANAMGGTVTLQSEVNVGSTFTVTIPIQTEALPI